MPGLGFRYVGQDRLPARLSEFDVERYFALTDSDVAAVNERFRRDSRAGVAIQLVFLRASGHTLDHVGTLPRQLLRYVGERLGLPTPTIASLRTLYQRYKTLYEHQVWTCEYLGMRSIGPNHWAELKAWMRQDATLRTKFPNHPSDLCAPAAPPIPSARVRANPSRLPP